MGRVISNSGRRLGLLHHRTMMPALVHTASLLLRVLGPAPLHAHCMIHGTRPRHAAGAGKTNQHNWDNSHFGLSALQRLLGSTLLARLRMMFDEDQLRVTDTQEAVPLQTRLAPPAEPPDRRRNSQNDKDREPDHVCAGQLRLLIDRQGGLTQSRDHHLNGVARLFTRCRIPGGRVRVPHYGSHILVGRICSGSRQRVGGSPCWSQSRGGLHRAGS